MRTPMIMGMTMGTMLTMATNTQAMAQIQTSRLVVNGPFWQATACIVLATAS